MTPGPGGQRPGSDAGDDEDDEVLRRRYRWLLACYPRQYRQQYEEEMLDVLLTAGAGGRRWPGAGESVDLVLGAVRIRARRMADSFSGSKDAEALAVVSLLVPALLLAGAAPGLHEIAWWLRYDGPSLSFLFTFPDAPGWAAWLVAAILGLLGWRRTAAAAACLAAIALAVLLTAKTGNTLDPTQGTRWVPLAVLGAVAAIASPGARHGLAKLGRPRYAAVLAASGLVIAAHLAGRHPLVSYQATQWLLPVTVVLACRPSTQLGRRVLLLLTPPGIAYLITQTRATDEWVIRYELPIIVTVALLILLLITTRHTNVDHSRPAHDG